MKKSMLGRMVLVAGLSCALAACGGGGDGGSAADTGTLRLALTDAPACGFDKVFVTVEKIRVHQSDSAGESEAGWSEIVLDPAKRVDLLSLQNGVLTELGQKALPAGKYTQLRLVLSENGSTAPFANAAIPTGSTEEVALATPSADQSGLKLKTNIDVVGNQLADFVIDFEACKSILGAGGPGKYKLRPVLAVNPRIS